MYYEEKWIDGKFCYRYSPDEKFKEFSIEQYRSKLMSLDSEIKKLYNKLGRYTSDF